ncbi:NAD dependent epimerase/dehydratase family protein [Phellopilus nigrolimitatus]|nr:NAD dependent epimerase/dehydratase family protein [Phellopilus nigrolimitatus]
MPSAIVTGASGLVGRGLVSELAKNANKWTVVYAISRSGLSASEELPANVKVVKADLTISGTTLAKTLEGVEAEYIFHAAHVATATEDESVKLNGSMLNNLLDVLESTGKEKKLKRLVVINGVKYYGLHLGPSMLPLEEDFPRVEGADRPPNFYYIQQDSLKERAKGKSWDWVITLPSLIIGNAQGAMNLTTALALYAIITRELGEDFIFPGSERVYRGFDNFTSAKLHAHFCEWVAFEPKAGGELFNVSNGDVQSWQSLWPKVAARFGLTVPADQFTCPAPLASSYPLLPRPPLDDFAKAHGLEGVVKGATMDSRVDLAQWSARPEVKAAWAKIAARENVQEDTLEKASWFFTLFCLGRTYDTVASITKSRKFGFNEYIDSWDAFEEAFDDLEAAKVIPKAK